MKPERTLGYGRTGFLAWLLLGPAGLACLCLPLVVKKADAACNSPQGQKYEITGMTIASSTHPNLVVCLGQEIKLKANPTFDSSNGQASYLCYAWSGSEIDGKTGQEIGVKYTSGGEKSVTCVATGTEWPGEPPCKITATTNVTVVQIGEIGLNPDDAELWKKYSRLVPGQGAKTPLLNHLPLSRDVIWTFRARPVKPAQPGQVIAFVSVGSQTNIELNAENSFRSATVSATTVPYIMAGNQCVDANVQITVEDKELSCCSATRSVPVGCPSCGEGCSLGSMKSANSCMDVRFSLGRLPYGGEAGSLWLFAETPAVSAATPQALSLPQTMPMRDYTPGYAVQKFEDSTVIFSVTNSVLRQILVPDGLADIVVSNQFAYELAFYSTDKVAGTNSLGLYTNNGPWQVKYLIQNPDASTNVYNRLRITRYASPGNLNDTNVSEYVWTEATQEWALSTGNGLRKETKSTTWDGTYTNVTRIVRDGSENIVSVSAEKYKAFSWGLSMVEQTVGSNGVSLTTTRTYYENAADTGKYSRVEFEVSPDGSWRKYDYNSMGLTTKVIAPFKDATTNDADSAALTRVTEYDYSLREGEVSGLNPFDPRTITERVQGAIVSKSIYFHTTNAAGEKVSVVERCASTNAAYGEANNLRTTTTYYSPSAEYVVANGPKSVEYPDGRMDTYTNEFGNYATNAVPGLCTFTPATNGTAIRQTVIHGTTASPAGLVNRTTKEVSVIDVHGNVVLSETLVYTGSGADPYERVDWTVQSFDEFGRALTTCRSDGTVSESTWGCCGKESETDAQGIYTTFSYDALDRLDTTTKEATPNILSHSALDAAGRVVSQTTYAAGGNPSLTTSNQYDLASRLTLSVDQAGLVTTYAYPGNGLTNITIQPGGLTNETVSYLDGRAKYTKLNGVIQSWNDYGANSEDGTQWSVTYTGPAGSGSPMWTKTTTDLLGRTIRTERPGFGGTVITNTSTYNSLGQLVKTTTPGQADTLYEYNTLGEQYRSGLHVDSGTNLNLAGSDRVSETTNWYGKADFTSATNAWARFSASMIYPNTGDSTPVTNSIQKTQLTGLGQSSAWGLLQSEMVSADIRGTQTVSRTFTDRSNKTVTQTVTYPDSTNDAVSVTVNGLLATSMSKTGVELAYLHDGLGRQTGVTDPRTGTSGTHYNEKGQVDWVQDAASNTTWFVYAAESGRQIAVTNALGKIMRQEFDAKGQLIRTWGDTTYPVSYCFDDWNRMTNMTTYRSGADWGNWDWPSPTNGDSTVWLYEPGTGLLTNKLYADGNGPAYAYTPEGRLQTRAWARGVSTTYSYTNTTGELIGIQYSSNSAPNVSFSFDRLGRQVSITDGQGTRTFGYDQYLALTNETLIVVGQTNMLARSQDSLGRSSGLDLNPAASACSVRYGFDSLGRFSALVATNNSSQVANVQYSYLANSDLLSGWSNSVGGVLVSRNFESHRDLLTSVQNRRGANLVAGFDYTNDELAMRTRRVDSSGVTNDFGYNTRSELTSAAMGTNQFGYQFDPIGNRIVSTNNAEVKQYTANALNQYTQITNGGLKNLSYDADGNLTNDSVWSFTWDGENRLVGAADGSTVASYSYDYMGRRFRKIVNGVTNEFLYDGWNLIREISSSGVTNVYGWGLDLSGSLQGAGGIGGLLSVTRNGVTYYPCCDGNGNITDYVDGDGNVVAHREYDPFGNTVVSSGTMVNDFHFWFSSKYLDAETGLYYFGRRIYEPTTGRFVSRDPMAELEGRNLCLFAINNPLGGIDILGLWTPEVKVTYRDEGGIEREVKASTKPQDIRLDPSTEVVGRFETVCTGVTPVPKKDVCTVRVKYAILMPAAGKVGPNPGNLLFVVQHVGPQDDVRDAGMSVYEENSAHVWQKKDGRAPRDAMIEHERGHARPYIEAVESLKSYLANFVAALPGDTLPTVEQINDKIRDWEMPGKNKKKQDSIIFKSMVAADKAMAAYFEMMQAEKKPRWGQVWPAPNTQKGDYVLPIVI